MRSTPKSTLWSCSPWACLLVAVMAMVLVLGVRPAGAQEASPESALVGVRQVSAGYYHSCAVLANTQVRCWGKGELGQLGQGVPASSATGVVVRNPANTGPLVNVVQVVAGYEFSCALLSTQEVRCWGYNADGELGDGTGDNSLLPVAVKDPAGTGHLQGVTQLSASDEHTCARLANGQARCWGTNGSGQNGNDSISESYLPVVVTNVAGNGALTGVAQIEAGSSTGCARLSNGEARCWGYNGQGQVGDGTTQPRHRPVVVKNTAASGPLTGVAQLTAGGAHTCARLTNGQARCWGRNGNRELGHGTSANAVLPVAVTNAAGTVNLTGVVDIDAGYHATCAALASHQVRCWGSNDGGLLGRGPIDGPDRRAPKPVKSSTGTGVLTGVAQLDLTESHACVRLLSGQARCWGWGEYGRLGNGGTTNRGLPVRVQV